MSVTFRNIQLVCRHVNLDLECFVINASGLVLFGAIASISWQGHLRPRRSAPMALVLLAVLRD